MGYFNTAGRVLLALLMSVMLLPLNARAVGTGDINRDGGVTVADATWILQVAVGLRATTADDLARADLNGNGKLDVADASQILQIAVGARPPISSPTIPPGPVTLVALGDSLTEGDRDDRDEGGYPGRLIAKIDALRPGSKLVNLGLSGWTSDDLIHGHDATPGELDRALAAKPMVALVWVGSNDLWYDVEYPGGQTEADTLAAYTANIDTILKSLKGTGAVMLVALLDDQSQRPFAHNPEIGLTDADRARMSRLAVEFNKAIQAKADEYGAITVDFYHTSIFTDPQTLADDGNHPNASGYDRITELWWEALRSRL